jgi:hypothetical protein
MTVRTLESEGWEKRGFFDEPRLSEVCEMYGEAGYEVMLVDFEPAFDGVCSVCLEGAPRLEKYKVVYTKRQ